MRRIEDRLEATSGKDNAAMRDVVALESPLGRNELRDHASEFLSKV